jgi:hypothetical protein
MPSERETTKLLLPSPLVHFRDLIANSIDIHPTSEALNTLRV